MVLFALLKHLPVQNRPKARPVVKSPLSHVMESDCQVLDIRQPFVGLKLHGIANWRLTFMERGVIRGVAGPLG